MVYLTAVTTNVKSIQCTFRLLDTFGALGVTFEALESTFGCPASASGAPGSIWVLLGASSGPSGNTFGPPGVFVEFFGTLGSIILLGGLRPPRPPLLGPSAGVTLKIIFIEKCFSLRIFLIF